MSASMALAPMASDIYGCGSDHLSAISFIQPILIWPQEHEKRIWKYCLPSLHSNSYKGKDQQVF